MRGWALEVGRMAVTAENNAEGARRGQIIDSAIQLIAEQGLARTSLSRIAEKAGISKAAVLYHFKNKDELLDEVLARVLGGLVTQVGARVDAAPTPRAAVFAYLRAMIGHLTANPDHVRVITEAMAIAELAGHNAVRADPSRWKALADLLAAAQAAGQMREFDTKAIAVLIGGAVDGLVGQWIAEPDFDLTAAASELETFIQRATDPH
jgi:TetR/AcrR family transcriptional regulator